ncbi:MAG: helix-turn-helix domain-containing protein [Thermoguttaceae bacterium]|nr:helix-turn-helix domain-containing protein [Thermoguttaceae bacterium]
MSYLPRRNANPYRSFRKPAAPAPRPTMGTADAAQFLGICDKTLKNLVKAGKIPCLRTGRKYLFHRETLEQLVKGELLTERTAR